MNEFEFVDNGLLTSDRQRVVWTFFQNWIKSELNAESSAILYEYRVDLLSIAFARMQWTLRYRLSARTSSRFSYTILQESTRIIHLTEMKDK
jgi:hypothetical protein